MKLRVTSLSLLLCSSLSCMGAIVLQDDFSGGQGDWATRGANTDGSAFAGGVVNISPNANGQPGSVYHSFDTVTLSDGETLTLTVDVKMDNTATPKNRDVRLALGFATTAITGDSTTLAVPLNGYGNTLPSAGSAIDSRVYWVDSSAGDQNFFNSVTTNIGDMALDNNFSVSSTFQTWVYEITRSGNDLIFSGSFGGSQFSTTVTASGTDIIDNYQFNTVALAYAYSPDFTATYDDLTLAVVPEPSTFAFFTGIGVLGLILLRRRQL